MNLSHKRRDMNLSKPTHKRETREGHEFLEPGLEAGARACVSLCLAATPAPALSGHEFKAGYQNGIFHSIPATKDG